MNVNVAYSTRCEHNAAIVLSGLIDAVLIARMSLIPLNTKGSQSSYTTIYGSAIIRNPNVCAFHCSSRLAVLFSVYSVFSIETYCIHVIFILQHLLYVSVYIFELCERVRIRSQHYLPPPSYRHF